MMDYNTLYQMLPVRAQGEMVLGLDTMRQLMEILGNPEQRVPIIHIAGTNGKGSVAAFLYEILREAGYRVGLFTSPSLVSINERIQIDGEMVTDHQLLQAAEAIKKETAHESISYTEFELFTAMAYYLFDQTVCDVAIVEVGLGGRLDATNVIDNPELTIITKIGLDHQAILGDTYTAIAKEKAAIIKPTVPVIVYPQQEREDVMSVIHTTAQRFSAPVHLVQREHLKYTLTTQYDQSFHYKEQMYTIYLLEEHQILNATVAIESAIQLVNKGWDIPQVAIKRGLAEMRWPARFERIASNPTIVVDGSHNADGMKELKQTIERYFPAEDRVAIVGFLEDKVDALTDSLNNVIPLFKHIICVTPKSPRALEAQVCATWLAHLGNAKSSQITVADTYEEAIKQAVHNTPSSGMVAIFGSFYFTGLIRQMILKSPPGGQMVDR